MPTRYFVSPLETVHEGGRDDELREHNHVLLIGQYVIIREPGQRDLEVMTNWLNITGVQQGAVGRRGINRRRK